MKAEKVVKMYNVLSNTNWGDISLTSYMNLSANIVEAEKIIESHREIVKKAMDKKRDKAVMELWQKNEDAKANKTRTPLPADKEAELKEKIDAWDVEEQQLFEDLAKQEITGIAIKPIAFSDWKKINDANPQFRTWFCHLIDLLVIPE